MSQCWYIRIIRSSSGRFNSLSVVSRDPGSPESEGSLPVLRQLQQGAECGIACKVNDLPALQAIAGFCGTVNCAIADEIRSRRIKFVDRK